MQNRIEEELKKEYEAKLEAYKTRDYKKANPRKYAFYTQQFINLKFVIHQIMSKKISKKE